MRAKQTMKVSIKQRSVGSASFCPALEVHLQRCSLAGG